MPLVRPPAWLSHQGVLAQSEDERAFARGLAQINPSWMQITYDKQGTGLSGHERDDFSLDGMVDELEALIEHLKLSQVALLCNSVAAIVGIAYTVRNPARVTRLILVNPVTSGAGVNVPRLLGALTALAQLAPQERDIAIDALQHLFAADDRDAPSLPMSTFLRDQARPSMALGLWATYAGSDVAPLLPQIRVPTLVLHSRNNRVVHFGSSVQLAARIPGARFLPIDGRAHVLFGHDSAELMQRSILEFLADERPSDQPLEQSMPSRLDVRLSRRQQHVLQLIATGKSSREIATELVLSERTVQRHIANVYAKLGVHNRVEATTVAMQLHL